MKKFFYSLLALTAVASCTSNKTTNETSAKDIVASVLRDGETLDLADFQWTREPESCTICGEKIEIVTKPATDLWQRTYYHFRNDNAPVLQIATREKFFSFVVKTNFEESHHRFDQCGVVMYLDSDNWLKGSIEYENDEFQHLGSVATNHGYSDWATTAIPADVKSMWYRLSRRDDDFCIECSTDGAAWSQMRVCHMYEAQDEIRFGIYACSPEDSSFKAVFTNLQITECAWKAHDGQQPDEELIFMLRLFLIMILFLTVVFALLPQIVWFLTWIIGKIFRFPVKYAPFGWTSLGLAVLVLVVLAYGFFIGRWNVETTHWTYENKDIPAAFDGMKIVHISDLHLSTFADNPRQLQRIVDRINAAEPDLICFTGDIVSLTLDEITPYTDVLSDLKATYGVCSVLGNHDFFLYVPQYQEDSAREAAVDSLTQIQRRELGWHLLRNESYAITCGTDTLTILGIDNNNGKKNGFRTICRGDLPKALDGTNGFRILMSHDPTFWTTDVVAKTDIPLTLSGHTHSAQVRLFGWTPASWVFEETAGRYDADNQTLYINIGLGCTAPIRLGANPEITILTLKK